MAQVRIPLEGVVKVVKDLSEEVVSWSDLLLKFPLVAASVGDDEEEGANASSSSSSSFTVDTTSPTVVQKTVRGSFSRPNLNYKQ